jgi:hypothetical protein
MIPSLSAWRDVPCGVHDKANSHPAALNNHRGVRVCDLLSRKLHKPFLLKIHSALLFELLGVPLSFLDDLLSMPLLLPHVGLKFLRGKRCCFFFLFPDAWQQNQLTLCFGMVYTNTLGVCCGRL